MKKIKVKFDNLTKCEFQSLCDDLEVSMSKGINYLITYLLVYNKDEITQNIQEMKKFEKITDSIDSKKVPFS